jgi:hypothetical protein
VVFDTAPATGVDVVIASDPAFTQNTSFENAGAFLPTVHDSALDRSAIRSIYLKYQASRALKAPVGEAPIGDLPSAIERANNVLMFDANGDPVVEALTVTTAAGSSVSTRALLAAIPGPSTNQSAILTEPGRGGTFFFSTANLSAQVAADPAQGIYVAPSSDPTGASGAWVRIADTVSIKHFGAVGDGVTDDTAAIQAAIDANAGDVLVPDGDFLVSSITMPNRVGFTLFGNGMGSRLIQKAGASGALIKWPTRATTCLDAHHTIRGLHFDATNGSHHVIDTTYTQTTTLSELFFNEVPGGKACIKLDGNPTDGTFMHDMRLSGIRIYVPSGSVLNGNAGILLGAHTADTAIDRFIMQGLFLTDYCILADAGALTTTISNSHPYNAKINVLKLSGGNDDFSFVGNAFDNALADIVNVVSSDRGRWVGNIFQAIPTGFSGVVLDASDKHLFSDSAFQTNGAATSCVRETNGSIGNKVFSGVVDDIASYTAPFDLPGANSFAVGFQGETPLGTMDALQFTGSAAQSQGTTLYYGANQNAASDGVASWRMNDTGRVKQLKVYFTATPAAGQTFTITLLKNNASIGSATVSNGQFSATVAPTSYANGKWADGDTFSVQSVFSATSGSANVSGALIVQR